MISMRWMMILFIAVLLSACPVEAQRPFFDRAHPSKVFGEARNYRIILPPDYEGGKRDYPAGSGSSIRGQRRSPVPSFAESDHESPPSRR